MEGIFSTKHEYHVGFLIPIPVPYTTTQKRKNDIERWEFREICNVLKYGEDNPETPNMC